MAPSLFLNISYVIALLSLATFSTQCDAARTFFVFGDSLVDNGNNNFLMTTARADTLPYGIDYPTHRPTGRFSNGLNIPDIISKSSSLHILYNFSFGPVTYVHIFMSVSACSDNQTSI
jgi:hypothetical protein